MTLVEVLIYLVIAGICGSIARGLAGGTSGGLIVSILLGFLGAFLGTWIARTAHLPALWTVFIGGQSFPIVWSIIGGILLVVVAQALLRVSYANRHA
jgi:uncharacterized membrane protein YeaQ/YmgE (transglycosylase-associated protein family)